MTEPATPPFQGLTTTDPMEQLVERALQHAGIAYRTDRGGGNEVALDFYLPEQDLHIEVKRFHSPRISAQMSRAANVLAIQGELAIRFFCECLERRPPVDGS